MLTVARMFWYRAIESEGSLVASCLLVRQRVSCMYQNSYDDEKSSRIVVQMNDFCVINKNLAS